MLGALLGWLSLLFDPLADNYITPVQPQERLRPEHQPWQQIITGVYSEPPILKIHDRHGNINWSFQRKDLNQILPDDVDACFHDKSQATVEVKYMNNGTSLGAVYSGLVLILNHTPQYPEIDKMITFALCRKNEVLWNSHTLEPLPGDLLAVGTTGQRPWDGILVYNASAANPLMGHPPVVQNITGLRAIHALIWDEYGQMLWAAGTDAAADGTDPVPAYGTVVAYPWNATTGLLSEEESYVYKLSAAYDEESEWGKGYPWWVGMHDLVPVPHERKFIVSDERDVHEFDIEKGEFTLHSLDVIDKYMKGFEATTKDRHGYNRNGEWEELPRSDLKSINLAPDGTFIYVQSLWREMRGDHTSIVSNGHRRKINIGDRIYRSRWFEEMDGWPKPLGGPALSNLREA
ncbi:hypothetical protein N7492_002610 [Penicillium capsulatum]|uniref:Uncharacterized protein n=1 Tax=Penicillium capsulatum TaxID=69766 RepID=A0A9W9ILU2_9EURO|nr:hypothetical protein N7492_002610 [Penicillium capsulatum]KAJ6122788.1 hypothetical protein N7512_005253 [Penicillium capsulatum]